MNNESNSNHHRQGARDDAFDSAMRTLHRDALQQVTPAVRWRLKPASAPPKGGVAGRFFDWRVGGALAGSVAAAVFALAVGVGLWRTPDTMSPAPAATLTAADANTGVLEQDPDFYAWLASEDADLLAVE